MPVTASKQYIFPSIPKKGWLYEIRISRGKGNGYFLPALDTLTLDETTRVMPDKPFGKLVKAVNNGDGLMTSDGLDITLLDPFTYSGKLGDGTVVTEDLINSHGSLLYRIFESDTTTLFTLWLTKRRKITKGKWVVTTAYAVGDVVGDVTNNMPWKCIQANTGQPTGENAYWTRAYNIFFGGDFSPHDISYPGDSIRNPLTANEFVRRRAQFKVKSGVDRLKNTFVGDLIGAIPGTYSNAVTGYAPFVVGDMLSAHPFYWGLTTKSNDDGNGYSELYGNDEDNYIKNNVTSPSWTTAIATAAPAQGPDCVDVSGYGKWDASQFDNVFPHGMWGVDLQTIIRKIAECTGLGFTVATDLTSAFTFEGQAYDSTTKSFLTTTNVVAPKDLVECFNVTFCINPSNKITDPVTNISSTIPSASWSANVEAQNPVGWAWNTPLSELIKQYCWDLGARAYYGINQTTGKIQLRILSRRTSFGSLPTITALTTTGNPTGGTFTLTVGANTTAPIAYNATAAAVQSALGALASVGAGGVSCTGGPLPAAINCSFRIPTTVTSTDSLTGGVSPASNIVATSALRMKKNFKREPSIVSKNYIEISNKGADGALQCPPKQNALSQGIQIKIAHRIHAWGAINKSAGNTTTFQLSNLIINSKWPQWDQDPAFRPYSATQPNGLGENWWICGAYWYRAYNGSSNLLGPASLNNYALLTGPDWTGFHAIGVMTENTTADLTKRTDSYFGPAQLYNRELIQTDRPFTREFKGIASYDGDLDILNPNIEASWPGVALDGTGALALQTFRAISLEIDILGDSIIGKFMQKPTAYTLYADQPVFMDNGSTGNTSSASSSTTTTAPGTSLAPAPNVVVDNPTVTADNIITPTLVGKIGLVHKRLAGQTADFEDWTDESNVVLSSIDKNGNFSAKTLTGTSLTLSLKGTSASTVDADSGTTLATKDYLLSKITGGTVTSIATGTGLTGGPITTTGTISLANTTVSPASYTNANITVDAQGRLTAASSGAAVATDYVKTDPGTTAANTVQPTVNSIDALTLKRYSSNTTGAMLQIRDEISNTLFSISGNGSMNLNAGATITNSSNTGLNIVNTGNGNSLIITSSATSVPIISVTDASVNNLFQLNPSDKSAQFGAATNSGSKARIRMTGFVAGDVQTVSGAVTLDATYHTALADVSSANSTVTLPSGAAWKGTEFIVICSKVTSPPHTLYVTSTDQINGVTTVSTQALYNAWCFVHTGVTWIIN